MNDYTTVAWSPSLSPEGFLAGMRSGVFPMGVGDEGESPYEWFSPPVRGVLLPGDVHVSRSMRAVVRDATVTVDRAFDEVVAACARPQEAGRWISDEFAEVYAALHRRGSAHSVEVWRAGRLVGGLFGVGIGGFFSGESMFHGAPNASKVALISLARRVIPAGGGDGRIVDVQWTTPHLASMGVSTLPRAEYLRRIGAAMRLHEPPW